MNKSNIVFLSLLCLAVVVWAMFAGVGGYTNRNAMIMARSTSVAATIGGQVDDILPSVGAKVSAGSLLATIRNDRIDRGRLVELQSRHEFLRSEIANAEREKEDLLDILSEFRGQADSYRAWARDNLQLLRTQTYHDLKAAEENYRQKASEVGRKRELHKKSHVSDAVLTDAKSNADIARSHMEALRAQLSRVDLRMTSAETASILREATAPSAPPSSSSSSPPPWALNSSLGPR